MAKKQQPKPIPKSTGNKPKLQTVEKERVEKFGKGGLI